MFQKLITSSIKHKFVVGFLTISLIVWGLWSLATLPFDSTPDITDNQVQVITQAPSLGAQEVEQYVTTPIEMALANIPRLQERRSISRSGLSVITLIFDDQADIYWARSQVNQVLNDAVKELPKTLLQKWDPSLLRWEKYITIQYEPRKGMKTSIPSRNFARFKIGLSENNFQELLVLQK